MPKNHKNKKQNEPTEDIYKYEDYNTYTQLPTEQIILKLEIVSGKFKLDLAYTDFGRGGTFEGDTTHYTLFAKQDGRKGQYLFLKIEDNEKNNWWRNEITLDRKNKTFVPWDARQTGSYPPKDIYF